MPGSVRRTTVVGVFAAGLGITAQKFSWQESYHLCERNCGYEKMTWLPKHATLDL